MCRAQCPAHRPDPPRASSRLPSTAQDPSRGSRAATPRPGLACGIGQHWAVRPSRAAGPCAHRATRPTRHRAPPPCAGIGPASGRPSPIAGSPVEPVLRRIGPRRLKKPSRVDNRSHHEPVSESLRARRHGCAGARLGRRFQGAENPVTNRRPIPSPTRRRHGSARPKTLSRAEKGAKTPLDSTADPIADSTPNSSTK